MTSTIPQFKAHRVGTLVVEFNPLSAGGFQVRAVEAGVCFYAKHHTFEDPAVNDYRRLCDAYTPDEIAEGGTVTGRVGEITVTVQCVRPGVYVTRTEQGSFRIESFCWQYGDLDEAYQAQTHALQAFTRYGTIDAIERAVDLHLAVYNRYCLRRDRESVRLTEAASRTLAGLATLTERAQLADIADDLARLAA